MDPKTAIGRVVRAMMLSHESQYLREAREAFDLLTPDEQEALSDPFCRIDPLYIKLCRERGEDFTSTLAVIAQALADNIRLDRARARAA